MLQFFICRDHSNFVNCVRFSPDGSKFITVSSDKKGIIFDGKSGEKIGELSSEDGHKGSIYAVNWSPDSKQVSMWELLCLVVEIPLLYQQNIYLSMVQVSPKMLVPLSLRLTIHLVTHSLNRAFSGHQSIFHSITGRCHCLIFGCLITLEIM